MFFYYAIESAGDYFDVASIFYSSAFSLFANKIEHQFFFKSNTKSALLVLFCGIDQPQQKSELDFSRKIKNWN